MTVQYDLCFKIRRTLLMVTSSCTDLRCCYRCSEAACGGNCRTSGGRKDTAGLCGDGGENAARHDYLKVIRLEGLK